MASRNRPKGEFIKFMTKKEAREWFGLSDYQIDCYLSKNKDYDSDRIPIYEWYAKQDVADLCCISTSTLNRNTSEFTFSTDGEYNTAPKKFYAEDIINFNKSRNK